MISRLTGELNQVLAKSGVPVNVVGGAEIVVARAIEMPRERIAALTLGEGPYLLVESPYAPTAVPQAILAGDDLPARPEVTTTSGASRRRRLTRIDRK